MKTILTRDDIKRHNTALNRIEKLEEWGTGKGSEYRLAVLKHSNSMTFTEAPCGYLHDTQPGPRRNEEAIFRKHMDAAIAEAIAYWKKQADLEEYA